jgi:hypothetical protein
MTKHFLLTFIFFAQHLYGQETIAKYTMEFEPTKEFTVQATNPINGGYKLYIELLSLDNSVKVVGFTIKDTEIPDLIAMLSEVKLKFEEWDNLAKTNNIVDLDKNIPVTVAPKMGGYFRYGDWKFDYYVTFSPRFLKKPDKTLALLHTGKMIASDNQFMDVSDAVIVFSNVKEIDHLISLLDPILVNNYFTKKNSTEDLFK